MCIYIYKYNTIYFSTPNKQPSTEEKNLQMIVYIGENYYLTKLESHGTASNLYLRIMFWFSCKLSTYVRRLKVHHCTLNRCVINKWILIKYIYLYMYKFLKLISCHLLLQIVSTSVKIHLVSSDCKQ